MKRLLILIAILIPITACGGQRLGRDAAAGTLEVVAPAQVKILFQGLVAFAKDDKGDYWALLVHTPEAKRVNEHTVPVHTPLAVFFPPSGEPELHVLDQMDLEIDVQGNTSKALDPSPLAAAAPLSELTSAKLNADVFTKPHTSAGVAARVKLVPGTLAAVSAHVIAFTSLVSGASTPHKGRPVAHQMTYEFSGSAVEIRTKTFDGSPRRKLKHTSGLLTLIIGNFPQSLHKTTGDLDSHFFWFYELAYPRPADPGRFVPQRGPKSIADDPCFMAAY